MLTDRPTNRRVELDNLAKTMHELATLFDHAVAGNDGALAHVTHTVFSGVDSLSALETAFLARVHDNFRDRFNGYVALTRQTSVALQALQCVGNVPSTEFYLAAQATKNETAIRTAMHTYELAKNDYARHATQLSGTLYLKFDENLKELTQEIDAACDYSDPALATLNKPRDLNQRILENCDALIGAYGHAARGCADMARIGLARIGARGTLLGIPMDKNQRLEQAHAMDSLLFDLGKFVILGREHVAMTTRATAGHTYRQSLN